MKQFKNTLSVILNHKFFLVFVVISCLYTMGRQSDKYFGWTNPKNILSQHLLNINSDGAGYYAYMPQWYIYPEKKGFTFLEDITTKYNTVSFISGVSYDYKKHTGTDKYYIGTSVCISPFFLGNHLIQKITKGDADGYSKSYQLSVSLAALFYWLLGIIGLIFFLKRFEISNFSISLLILIISLGTNLNYYAVYLPSFSHVYSFCAITWFLFFAKSWADKRKTKYFISLSLLLGLVFIIRPTNGMIVLFLPFLFNNWKDFQTELLSYFQSKKVYLALALLVFCIPVFLQILNIHSQTGNWTINTYTTEHFDHLTNPKMREVLFGYRKGFFTYAPIMFLLIPSFLFLKRQGNYFLLGWSIVFLLFVYLTSSWWCWWYGGGLGMRPFVDFLSFLILPIALLFKYIPNWTKMISIAFIGTMIWVYQIFQIQFNWNIIHYNDMTAKTFWQVFLQTDERFSWVLHFKEYTIDEKTKLNQKQLHLQPDREWSDSKISSREIILKSITPDPKHIFIPDSTWNETSIGIELKGQMMISNPVSNPSFIVNLYRGGNVKRKQEIYIGNTINHLHEYVDFKKTYTTSTSYQSIDSIEVIMTKGAPVTGLKNIRCTFFSLKKKK